VTGTTPRCFFGGLPKSIVYDDFDRKIEAKRSEMRRLAGAAIIGSRAYQQRGADWSGIVGDCRIARHHRGCCRNTPAPVSVAARREVRRSVICFPRPCAVVTLKRRRAPYWKVGACSLVGGATVAIN
jgi:hypothetical protein